MMYCAGKIFERIPEFPSCHGSTIAELPDGDLLAAWYAGSREGAKDVAIFTSRKRQGSEHWMFPKMIVNTPKLLRGQPCAVCRCEWSNLAVLRDDVRRTMDGVQGVLPKIEYDGT